MRSARARRNLWYRLRAWHGLLSLYWLLFERNWRSLRDLSRALSPVHSLEFDFAQIPARSTLPDGYAEGGYAVVEHPLGVALCSRDVNGLLREKASSVRLREVPPFHVLDRRCRSVPEWVKDVSPCLLRQAFRGRSVLFNSGKVRLCTDLLPDSLKEETPFLIVQKTDYFSSLCTNEAALRRVLRREAPDPPVLEEFRFLYATESNPARPGVLATLCDSPCANHVGVSTIGVTQDGHVLWNVQPGRSAQSANRIAPAGSGSADYSDLREGDGLLDFLTRSIERELREECRIAPHIPVRTKIVGYARLLHRGGKPEFFGFSEIGCGKTELAASASEAPFLWRTDHARPASGPVPFTARDLLEEIGSLRQNLGGAFSFLMHLNLLFLEEHLQGSG